MHLGFWGIEYAVPVREICGLSWRRQCQTPVSFIYIYTGFFGSIRAYPSPFLRYHLSQNEICAVEHIVSRFTSQNLDKRRPFYPALIPMTSAEFSSCKAAFLAALKKSREMEEYESPTHKRLHQLAELSTEAARLIPFKSQILAQPNGELAEGMFHGRDSYNNLVNPDKLPNAKFPAEYGSRHHFVTSPRPDLEILTSHLHFTI
ncbi:hypothetical protein B0H10DRAFT_1156889 [Mycena sp. CBHHK59/15]|nr:hypothetical protein B0H10DRAFT_1156889 [Mycena sp. CBHHK59/15]